MGRFTDISEDEVDECLVGASPEAPKTGVEEPLDCNKNNRKWLVQETIFKLLTLTGKNNIIKPNSNEYLGISPCHFIERDFDLSLWLRLRLQKPYECTGKRLKMAQKIKQSKYDPY